MNLNLKDYKKIRTPFVFFDETGSINDKVNRFFGLGMIKCMQPYYVDCKIRKIRQIYRFFDEIKWNKLSKINSKVIQKIIDCIFETPGVYFSAIIINKNNVDFEKEYNNNPYKAYESFTKDLLLQSISGNEILTILADYVTVPANINFEVDVKHSINESLQRLAIGGIHRIDSKGSNLIQIVDLFLGAVVYNYKLENKLVTGDKNKIIVLKSIQKKLRVNSLMGDLKNNRFIVIEQKK